MSQDFCGVFLSKETEPHFLSFALLLHFTTIFGKNVTDHCSIVSCSFVSVPPPFPTLFPEELTMRDWRRLGYN